MAPLHKCEVAKATMLRKLVRIEKKTQFRFTFCVKRLLVVDIAQIFPRWMFWHALFVQQRRLPSAFTGGAAEGGCPTQPVPLLHHD
jgi:hypothetical protein